MVMLTAAASVCRDRVAAVATFDHGTGGSATLAVNHVVQQARNLGIPFIRGGVHQSVRGEAAWRTARWDFLRAAGATHDARVATAHSADDQIETVLMRVLRNAGARGIAGLYARNEILRPLLTVRRDEIARYASEAEVSWIVDPTNSSTTHLRNRVRRDLLPALNRVQPGLPDELLELARKAAALRDDVEAFLDGSVRFSLDREGMMIPRSGLLVYDEEQLRLIWPALAARFGVVLDRRGTRRLAAFTIQGVAGARIQLSGGYEVVLHRDVLRLRRSTQSGAMVRDTLPLGESVNVGAWRISRRHGGGNGGGWVAELPGDSRLAVRLWQPGDRMIPLGSTSPRRVKALLRDAGIDAGRRAGWPVVLSGDEIVWVPGVRRGGTATVWPGIVYECEHVGS